MTTTAIHKKYLIIGAGPGGLQMAYFLERAGRDYLVLERNDVAGSFFATYPRHRKLISINKKHNYYPEDEFNWRHDWNSLLSDDPEMRFTKYSDELFSNADTLYQYLQDYAGHFELKIAYGVKATSIAKDGEEFLIATENGPEYRCEVLLLGLGSVNANIPEDIEGIEHTTGYDEHSLDLEMYKNKRVGIIGQGNSAFETADYLSGTASLVHVLTKRPVKLAWNTHFPGDVRAVNNSIYDMYQLKSLHAVLNPRVKKITRTPAGTLVTNHEYDFPRAARPGTLKLTREYDYIIRCTGWKWVSASLFDESAEPNTWKGGKYPELTGMWESKNVSNLFFIGGAMQGNDRQAASGFIHGFRYNIRTLFHLLEEKFEGIPYPSQTLDPLDFQTWLDSMYQRFSVTAALFQLYGVLCDVLVLSEDRKSATLYQELPLKYVKDLNFPDRHVLVFTLEFGFDSSRNKPSNSWGLPIPQTRNAPPSFIR